MASAKDKKQIVILGIVLVGIVGVILYFYGDALLPQPSGDAPELPSAQRLQVPAAGNFQELFDRADYKALRRYGDVPVRPIGGQGNPSPFEPITEVSFE